MTSVGHHPLVGQRLCSLGAATRSARTRSAVVRIGDEVERVDGDAMAERDAPQPRTSNPKKLADRERRWVGARRDDDLMSIAVMDTGIGIATRDRTRLCRSSEQLTLRSGDPPGGTGLGLARIKRLLKLHGGTIDVESELGIGTILTVRIPVA
jgi:light-regulated signal transduction histidine kinase (bacteriophytochrome)